MIPRRSCEIRAGVSAGRRIRLPNWDFVSTSPADLQKLASAFGLRVFRTKQPDRSQHEHGAGRARWNGQKNGRETNGRRPKCSQPWKMLHLKVLGHAKEKHEHRKKLEAFVLGSDINSRPLPHFLFPGSSGQTVQANQAIFRGRYVYQTYCAACHDATTNLHLLKDPPRLDGLFENRLSPAARLQRTTSCGTSSCTAAASCRPLKGL